jgi:hypothetical protein
MNASSSAGSQVGSGGVSGVMKSRAGARWRPVPSTLSYVARPAYSASAKAGQSVALIHRRARSFSSALMASMKSRRTGSVTCNATGQPPLVSVPLTVADECAGAGMYVYGPSVTAQPSFLVASVMYRLTVGPLRRMRGKRVKDFPE